MFGICFLFRIIGEKISFNRKNQGVYEGVWDETGLIIGNKKMKWQDTGGALRRRLIVFRYLYKVIFKDSLLHKRIENRELAAILCKCMLAYQDAKLKFKSSEVLSPYKLSYKPHNFHKGSQNIPPTMQEWNDRLQLEFCPLFCLLKESLEMQSEPLFHDTRKVPKEELKYIPLSLFARVYTAFVRTRFKGLDSDLTQDVYASTFRDFNIHVEENVHKMWQGSLKRATFVVGIGSCTEDSAVYQELKTQEQEEAIDKIQSTSTEEEVLVDRSELLSSMISNLKTTFDMNQEEGWKALTELMKIGTSKGMALPASIMQEVYKLVHSTQVFSSFRLSGSSNSSGSYDSCDNQPVQVRRQDYTDIADSESDSDSSGTNVSFLKDTVEKGLDEDEESMEDIAFSSQEDDFPLAQPKDEDEFSDLEGDLVGSEPVSIPLFSINQQKKRKQPDSIDKTSGSRQERKKRVLVQETQEFHETQEFSESQDSYDSQEATQATQMNTQE